MKKFLALVLALIMTMSLVTISAGAEDFTDDSKITYSEAVDVMTAIGVVGGYADGSFNPTAGLTRGAAAKIICNMLLGPTTAEALVANEAPFVDVAVDNVFAGYIAYCVNEGIISGYADGTFKPAAPLTGYAFMKMLLGALGYDAVNEGYVGSNWSIQVAKRALAIELDDGLVSDFAGAKALTREEACLYAFNTLNAQMVEYDNDSKITIGDIVISNSSKAEGKVVVGTTTPVLFRDEYFKKLDLENTSASDKTDVFGRPSHTWYTSTTKHNDDTKVGTYSDDPAAVLVMDKAVASVETAVESKDYFDYAAADENITTVYVNGSASGVDKYSALQAGDVVEVYNNAAGQATTVVVERYSIAKINEVSTKLTKVQKEDGATCKFNLVGATGTWYTNDKVEGFDAATYVEDAYILYIVKSGEIIASEIAESVEGKITATKGTKVAVEGVYYEDTTSAAYGDEGIFYLDKAGRIVAKEATGAKSDNYAYIYNVTVKTAADADGVDKETVTVYYVTADGTKASAPAKFEKKAATGSNAGYGYDYFLDDGSADTTTVGDFLAYVKTSDGSKVLSPAVVAYSINADGKFVLETAKDSIAAAGQTGSVSKTDPVADSSKVATDDTVFVFVYTDANGKYVTKVVTGYKNVTVSGVAMQSVYNEDNEAIYTFVGTSNGAVTTDAKYAVLLSATPVVTENADEDVIYTYDVAIDGEETTLSFNYTDGYSVASAFAGKVIAYKLVDGYAQIDTSITSGNMTSGVATKSDVASKGAGYFMVGSTYMSTVDAEVYTITVEFDNTTSETNYKSAPATTSGYTVESIVVSEGATFDAGDWVYYTVASGETNVADVVYVVEFVA